MGLLKRAFLCGFAIVLTLNASYAATVIISDTYNVTGSGTGFNLDSGINTGINPPATRLGGIAAPNLRYIHTATKDPSAYSITGKKIQVTAAANPGRFVLSADGVDSFDFGPALGISSATATNPVIYDFSIRMNNNSGGAQRFSFALGTTEGDANSWAFGVQVYRANSGDTFYTIGKRVDTSASGLASDLNSAVVALTGNTFGNDITILVRVTDAGPESTTFNSRIQMSINGGNSWFYDTATDGDLPNGWRLNGTGRHVMWDVAPNAGPVTYDAFSLKKDPPASTANTSSTFRAMAYNIHSATGPDGKVNTQRIANFIISENVDLVALNEVARFMPRSDGRDLIGELAQETGMTYVFSNNSATVTGDDEFGNAILSKYPVLFRDHRLLPKVDSNEQRGWLKAVVEVNGKFVSFCTTHLDFKADNTERLMCVTNINLWLDEETFPVIIGGDFNDTPDSPMYARMELKWTDIWPVAGDGTLGRTVPCPGPPYNARIDYIWKAKTSSVTPINAEVGYSLEGSDHYPVLTQFILTIATNHATGFFFPFDEGTGSKVTDLVGGLTGPLGAGTPAWSGSSPTGASGDYSLYFNGSRKLTIPDPMQVIGTNGFNDDYTLQAWVKLPLNYSPAERAIMFQYERQPGFSFSINTNRTLHTTTFKIKDIASTATVPNDGEWHHVAVVHRDGANMKFYIDGALVSTVNYTKGAGFRTSSTITVGSAADGANPFTGYLARIGFESRALSPEELDYPARPSLGIRRDGAVLTLFWPSTRYGYTLQMNSSLQSTGWLDLASEVQGDENQATVVPGPAGTFFRLKR